jgi:hypothetical protein
MQSRVTRSEGMADGVEREMYIAEKQLLRAWTVLARQKGRNKDLETMDRAISLIRKASYRIGLLIGNIEVLRSRPRQEQGGHRRLGRALELRPNGIKDGSSTSASPCDISLSHLI